MTSFRSLRRSLVVIALLFGGNAAHSLPLCNCETGCPGATSCNPATQHCEDTAPCDDNPPNQYFCQCYAGR